MPDIGSGSAVEPYCVDVMFCARATYGCPRQILTASRAAPALGAARLRVAALDAGNLTLNFLTLHVPTGWLRDRRLSGRRRRASENGRLMSIECNGPSRPPRTRGSRKGREESYRRLWHRWEIERHVCDRVRGSRRAGAILMMRTSTEGRTRLLELSGAVERVSRVAARANMPARWGSDGRVYTRISVLGAQVVLKVFTPAERLHPANWRRHLQNHTYNFGLHAVSLRFVAAHGPRCRPVMSPAASSAGCVKADHRS